MYLINGHASTPFANDEFVSYLGVIYKNRFFPQLIKEMTVEDLLYPSQSDTLISIQKAPLKNDGNPLVRTDYQALSYPQLKNNIVEWSLLSGIKDEDNTRRVFKYNNTVTYATANFTFFHKDNSPKGDYVEQIEVQPWRRKVDLAFGSDSVQYEPNIGQKTDIAYYSPVFKAQLDLDYDQVTSVFDTKTYRYKPRGYFYELSKPGQESVNKYHNYIFPNAFNSSAITAQSMFVTTPLYSTFGDDMVDNACELFNKNNEEITFKNDYDTSINIEFYSGFAMDSKQSYQINYVFDTYSLGLDSFTFFVPSYIYTSRLLIGEEFASSHFKDIRSMEKIRKLILIVCFAVGGVLFAMGISL